MSDLSETKGSFKLVGLATGLQNENVYRKGYVENGANKGRPYRSLRFGVKTSPTNLVNVELYGVERETVYPYKRKKGGKGETTEIPWEQRFNPPAGFKVIGVDINLDGKRTMLVEHDAIEHIYNNLENGDSVYVSGDIRWEEFLNREEEEVVACKEKIKAIYKTKDPVDFEKEDFKETAGFVQEIVVINVIADKEENRLVVNAYVIGYNNYMATQFYIYNEPDNKELMKYFNKLKFGDAIKVFGEFRCAEVVETSEGKVVGKKSGGFDKPSTKTGDLELLIVGADEDSLEKKKYKEDDFEDKNKDVEEEVNNENDDVDWDDNEEQEDDLPF